MGIPISFPLMDIKRFFLCNTLHLHVFSFFLFFCQPYLKYWQIWSKKKFYQWLIQSLSGAGIPFWAPKLGAQIKGKLKGKQHQQFNHIFNANASTCCQTLSLSKTPENVELQTLCMSGSAAQVCLNASQCIVCINESNIFVLLVCPN